MVKVLAECWMIYQPSLNQQSAYLNHMVTDSWLTCLSSISQYIDQHWVAMSSNSIIWYSADRGLKCTWSRENVLSCLIFSLSSLHIFQWSNYFWDRHFWEHHHEEPCNIKQRVVQNVPFSFNLKRLCTQYGMHYELLIIILNSKLYTIIALAWKLCGIIRRYFMQGDNNSLLSWQSWRGTPEQVAKPLEEWKTNKKSDICYAVYTNATPPVAVAVYHNLENKWKQNESL